MRDFRPDPKPVKGDRPKKKGETRRNTYLCSNGERVTQAYIDSKLSKSYKEKHIGNPDPVCEGCENSKADDNSHIISQRRLKQIGKTDLIWNTEAYCSYCRECHMIFEGYKSGEFMNLNNIKYALQFLKDHDTQTYIKVLHAQ